MFVCIALLFLFAFECFGVANRGEGGGAHLSRETCATLASWMALSRFSLYASSKKKKTVLFLEDLLSGCFHLLFLFLLLLSLWGIKAAKY